MMSPKCLKTICVYIHKLLLNKSGNDMKEVGFDIQQVSAVKAESQKVNISLRCSQDLKSMQWSLWCI